MRIDVVCFTGDSGLTEYSVSLARALSTSHQTAVITSVALPARCDRLGFSVVRLFRRSRQYPIDIVRFIGRALDRRPDWLLFQGPLKFALIDGLCVRLLRMFGLKAAITVHDVLPHYPTAWDRFAFGFYYRSFLRVIAHSRRAQKDLKSLGVYREVLVVPHGIYDIYRLSAVNRQQARQRIGNLSAGEFVVLFFGHLEPRKGLMEFLSAAAALRQDTSVKFIVAGANNMAQHGARYAAALEQTRNWPNVVLHDQRIPFEEVENYFAACDVVALPYLEGTTSGVLKIALAFGRPAIVTDVGDFPEQLPPGAGKLLPLGEALPARLTEAIKQIQADSAVYLQCMQAAGSQAQWPDIADAVVRHLRET